MQFIYDKGIYKVARITGPKHNLLGIRLADSKCAKEVISLPTKGNDQPNLDAQNVLRQVEEGLIAINQELGKQYFISEIYFIPSDTKPSSVYGFLIQELIRRIDCSGKFITV